MSQELAREQEGNVANVTTVSLSSVHCARAVSVAKQESSSTPQVVCNEIRAREPPRARWAKSDLDTSVVQLYH